ncbi:GAF domain-containing protein [Psychromonas ingrahamii 37]|uniref:GAF domain-containing protein n=1 Tax=Psychromonas ingrahamii (strain DSM 17664 / CCUG 51855 / 37) TaxID=357804 RepID=A1SUY8_PSYIN|nr:GAF domain-containing protein [Psychromonas ingrahamii]ABM03303.1 GAF domain-containing protein [Psychromonas ingrahamii 37]
MTFKDYKLLSQQAVALIADETDLTANLANLSALLNMNLDNINWVGFYLLKDNQLVLGPFQGQPACIRIPLNTGVCGKAFSTNTIQRVADVQQFVGHIACDANSQSEIVLPISLQGAPALLLDIDSPIKNRFTQNDQDGLAYLVEQIQQHL